MAPSSLAGRIAPVPLLVLATALLSWAYVGVLEPHGMDVGALLRPRIVAEGAQPGGMDLSDGGHETDMEMSGSSHGSMPVMPFLSGWLVMMAAMMLPAIVPMVMLLVRWSRSQGQPQYRIVAFVAGYLLVWGVAGVVYYGLIEVFDRLIPPSDVGVRIAASVLFLAGLYQFSPLKDRCLTACRTPLGFLMTHGGRMARGIRGYVGVGARHGLFCLGCCWMLMVILVLLGVMNIIWMLVVAGVIFAEKATSSGAGVAKLTGAIVAVAAGSVLIMPRLILALG